MSPEDGNQLAGAFSFLEKLVAIPSPTGQEDEVVGFLIDQARADGFRTQRDAVGNFIAEAGRGTKELLFVGHVDTVPGTIPVRVEGKTLYGRGAVDAKGPLAAFYWAARRHLDDPEVRIRIVGAVDEEGDSRGARALHGIPAPAWIVIGEPSGSDGLTLGYKGILRGRLDAQRPHHHGAFPAPSAADELVAFWTALGRELGFEERFEAVQGRLLEIASHNDGLTDSVRARFALRLPPGLLAREAEERLRSLARASDFHLEVGEMMDAAVVDKRSPLVAAYLAAIRGSGLTPRLKRKTGTADFNHLHSWFPQVPIVAYGPGDSSLDHTPDERIGRIEFEHGICVNDAVLRRLSKASLISPRAAA